MKTTIIPFDAEKAKNGAKVVTRNGLPVKILDYPVKNEDSPILGLIPIEGKEFPKLFTKNGNHYSDCTESRLDLFIEEEVEEDDSDYDPYKEVVESIMDMVERCSPNNVGALRDFYHEVKAKCREAIEYYNTWNKKQEEQKTSDNKPKFQVGDWIVQENVGVYKVTEICESWYEVIDSDELHYSIDFDQESMCHLWTIQDAKPGDALAIGWKDEHGHDWQKIVIFKSLTEFSVEGYGNTFKNNELAFEDESVPHLSNTWTKNLHPATKEQRELLFKKMKEEGYEWNSSTKELKKIDAFPAEKKIKPRRMTHQELAWWLRDKPEEHRELKMSVDDPIVDSLYYYDNETNVTVSKDIIIRRNGGEWEEPLITED